MNKNRPASVLTAVAMLTAQSFPAYAHNALPVSFGSPGPHHYAGGQNAHAYWRGLAEKQGMFTSLEQQMLSTIHSSNPSIFGTGHPQRYEQQTQSDQVQQNTNNQTANTSLVQSNNSASATQGTTGGSQLPANGKG